MQKLLLAGLATLVSAEYGEEVFIAETVDENTWFGGRIYEELV